MAISYKRLFKLLIDREMKKKDLQALTGLSYSTLQKLENSENVRIDGTKSLFQSFSTPQQIERR